MILGWCSLTAATNCALRHPGAEVDDREAGALQHHADEVLADVVQVALDGADHDGAHAGLLAGRHVRAQEVEAGLHHPGAEQHLGDEDLGLAHALAHHLHAGQQGLVEDLARRGPGGEQRLGERQGGGGVAVDDGLLELVLHGDCLLQATPAARSVSSTIACTRAATSSGTGSGWYSRSTSRAFSRHVV